ncbi:VPA1269 family protein [Aliihoeflea sp. 40Bstr573]|uniref:VPA1269 family protein n=1 Tax=Aliihoeflea sp. 40Bstr573 TaxID=2696467 RepID=UPI002094918E|nr:VPA1269 family protein [Aliihoeflea sp. 40Bstr573]MCO6388937.1 hypothetical protein [Aliihoeflea sp. 40Bstr573]
MPVVRSVQLADNLGGLNFRAVNLEARANLPFGMISYAKPAKSVHFKKSALTQAAVALGYLSDKTPHGKRRTNSPRGTGSIVDFTLTLSRQQQLCLIEAIVNQGDIDDWMVVSQGSTVGWRELREKVARADDVFSFLSYLAGKVDRWMGDTAVRVRRSLKPEEAVEFAHGWFAQYLARRGIWIWPARYVGRIIYLYPSRYLPLATRMSVGRDRREFADFVYRFHQTKRHQTASMTIQAFAMSALAGNTWLSEDSPFRWYPLAAFKECSGQFSSKVQVSTSINAVYKLATEWFGDATPRGPEARLFLTSARIGVIGVDAFDWTARPTPRNTQRAARITGSPVTAIPAHVKSWAGQLRELLPHFGVKDIRQIENDLNIWLIYLLTLDAADAPPDFRSISRPKHVHDLSGVNKTGFRTFLVANFSGKAADWANRAISAMAKAFYLASVRDEFVSETSPFDLEHDRLGRSRAKRSDVTPRKPLEQEVWEFIVRMNREGDFAFARSLAPGRFQYRLRNRQTGEFEVVFWPAEAIIVDILLNSGMRLVSARWLDSGEGDQYVLDVEGRRPVPNQHVCATVDRNEGFLQLVTLPGREASKTIGMRVGLNKTGKPFVIPWTDPAIVQATQRMLALQQKYNPITSPVTQRLETTRASRADANLFPDIYPLFRDPGVALNLAISEEKVRGYWKELLHACQDGVNKLLGHEYPLVDENGPLFDIHSLRVTMVSNLLSAGVNIEIVKDLVGHATWIMTWHYNGLRSARLNTAVAQAMAMRSEALDQLVSGNSDLIRDYADQTITPPFVEDHVGAGLLRRHAEDKSASLLDVFDHGICPGGTCSIGGQKYMEGKFRPVWRDRACSGCRFRATGPRFKDGIKRRINILMAELRLTGVRMRQLAEQIEAEEQRTGKTAHRLRKLRHADSSLKDNLTFELSRELQVSEIIRQVERAAKSEGKTADNILIPSVPGFDPSAISCSLVEVHHFELLHSLVRDMRLLPSVIMEIPHGAEANMIAMVREIMRVNDLGDLMIRIPMKDETDACLRIGDALLDDSPDADRFQQLLEGIVRLDERVLDSIRAEIATVVPSLSAGSKRDVRHEQ